MLFSVGYGPDQSGKVTMNFEPLNNDGGERWLNVAVTRAREQVVIFSSLQPGDLDLSRTNACGVKDFKRYLEYAKKGKRALIRDDQPAETLAFVPTFEEAVYNASEAEGHDVETQIQSSGYSIDLAIRHPKRPGNYVLGIECDGAAYPSSKTARDRDRTRQMIHEDSGVPYTGSGRPTGPVSASRDLRPSTIRSNRWSTTIRTNGSRPSTCS